MSTKEPAATAPPEPAGASLFSMDDLRARLDAPLFHRDQGLAVSALPRLREISFDHAAEDPAPVPDVEVPVEAPVTAAPSTQPSARPQLVSFSDMMSIARSQPAEAELEPSPQPVPQPLAQRHPELLRQPEPVVSESPELGPIETQALLAVLAAFETSANRLHELNNPSGEVDFIAIPQVPAISQETPLVSASLADFHIAPAQEQRSSVEAELNRLAFLPDQDEHVGPVVVPIIAPTEQHQVMAVPVLSQHEMYSPRATPAIIAKRNAFESALEATNMPRRAKKGIVRRFFSLVVLMGLLGGGLYAAKYYLLDPMWDTDVKVLVEQVEAARNLEFDHAVEVTELLGDDYAMRIAKYSLGTNSSNEEVVAGEWRALGLVSGVLDMRLVGLQALPETPAFYDAGSEKIYVVSGLPPETYRFAMYRALTAALLDQEFGWGGRIDDASPTVIRGTRALFEADALATASSIVTPTERALVREQLGVIVATFGGLPTPTVFGTTEAGRLGVSLRAFVESIPIAERGPIFDDATINDYQALDLRRLVSGVTDGVIEQQQVLRTEVVPDGSRSQGMLFWYHALASRLDAATAWNTALAIQLDDVVVTAGATGSCVAALLTVNPASLDAVNAVFTAWAAAAPVESATTVVPTLLDGIARVGISACDPGVAVLTNSQPAVLSLGGAPLRSEQYRLLLITQPTLTKAQAACAVYGGDNVSLEDDRLVGDTIEPWLRPAAHPAPDATRADCVAA